MSLRLDWCDHKSAKWACEHYHYARKMVTGKTTKIGVWENDKFIGCLIFGRGANNSALKKYGLDITEGCELMRVALKKHEAPVTKIMSISRKLLLKLSPNLKLIISYADPEQGHEGTIYKADNWIYEGLTQPVDYYINEKGEELHWRNARFAQKRGEKLDRFYKPGKHKFIYPLDRGWYNEYTRQKHRSDATDYQSVEGGAVPTLTHHTDDLITVKEQ